MRRLDSGALVAIVVVAFCSTQAAAAPRAYIPCYDGGVAVIDTATDTVATTIPTALGPSGVTVGPGSSRVYVTNIGTFSVAFLDTAANAVVDTAPVGVLPFALDVNPTGTRLYVGDTLPSTVSVVDTATATVLNTIPLASYATGIAVHPNGDKVYVVTPILDQVAVISTASNLVIDTIPVGDDPNSLAINPAGTRAYVSRRLGSTISVIDTTTDQVIDTISVGSLPLGVSVVPDGHAVYVSNYGDDTVTAVDVATGAAVATIPVGTQPYGVSVHPDGSRVYVANYGSDNVSVIDTATNTELYRVPVCGSPKAIGKFITGNETTASVATAVTGWMSMVVMSSPIGLIGTLQFDAGARSVFGTPVDLNAALGGVPMDVTLPLLSALPSGYTVSASATSTSVPSFSLSGTGHLAFSPHGILLRLGFSPPTGTTLPVGPSYTLVADLTGALFTGYAGPFTIGASLAANTPVGSDVTVPVTTTVNLCPGDTSLLFPVSVEFSQVTAAGSTLVSAACQSPASIPPNIRLDLGELQLFFDVSTSASYTAPITICGSYPDANQDGFVDPVGVNELTLRILHDDSGGNFQPPVNQFVDPVLNRVCAEVDHLSPFLIATEGVPKGFVAPDDDTRKCENQLPKLSGKLLKAILKCNRKAAEAAFKSKSFDAAVCEVAARAKYDDKVALLGPCPACVSVNALTLGDAAASLANGLNAALYCEGTAALPADFGFVPPSDAAVSCAKGQGKNVAKLTKQLGKCYRKLADAAFKAQSVDVDACLAAAGADFDAAVPAGCGPCALINALGLRNQVERFAVGILNDVYCAGSTPLP